MARRKEEAMTNLIDDREERIYTYIYIILLYTYTYMYVFIGDLLNVRKSIVQSLRKFYGKVRDELAIFGACPELIHVNLYVIDLRKSIIIYKILIMT